MATIDSSRSLTKRSNSNSDVYELPDSKLTWNKKSFNMKYN